MGYLWLVIAFCANGIANVLLKYAGQGVDASKPLVPQLATNVPLIMGLAIFAVNVAFYFLALRALPLSVAYPVMVGMSFLIVSTASLFFFRESMSTLNYLGLFLIVVGLIFATLR